MLSRKILRFRSPWVAAGCVTVALALGGAVAADAEENPQKLFQRPIPLGVSGSSIEPILDHAFAYCYTGTLGALIKDLDGNQYILSNNHVLAKENDPDNGLSPDGREIIQPGLLDDFCTVNGGNPENYVGYLTSYVPIVFGKGRNLPDNDVDAAIALTNTNGTTEVDPDGVIFGIGPLTAAEPVENVIPGLQVQKSGRTTGRTFGAISEIAVNIKVSYLSGTAYFVNQIAVTGLCGTQFSDSGDSGSLIVNLPKDEARAAVGLLFAGGGGTTFANRMTMVLAQLGGEPTSSGVETTQPISNPTMVVDSEMTVDDVSGNAGIPTCSDDGNTGGGSPGKGKKPRAAASPEALATAAAVANANRDRLMELPDVVGFGIGANQAGEAVIRLYLETGRAPAGLPQRLNGIAVERVVTGRITPY